MTIAGFNYTNPLSELATPIDIGSGVVTPETLRARARYNMGMGSATATTFGTVTTAATTTALEHFTGIEHRTIMTLTSFAVGTSADNASLGIGAKLYTFPAGNILITGATIHGGVTAAISVTTNTPEVALGTVIASGAIASTTTTMENIVDGGAGGMLGDFVAVAPDVAGTATLFKGMLATSKGGLLIKASGGLSHDVYLNVAAAWVDVTAPGAVTFTGTVTLNWQILS